METVSSYSVIALSENGSDPTKNYSNMNTSSIMRTTRPTQHKIYIWAQQ